jgi:hypothetical protein
VGKSAGFRFGKRRIFWNRSVYPACTSVRRFCRFSIGRTKRSNDAKLDSCPCPSRGHDPNKEDALCDGRGLESEQRGAVIAQEVRCTNRLEKY